MKSYQYPLFIMPCRGERHGIKSVGLVSNALDEVDTVGNANRSTQQGNSDRQHGRDHLQQVINNLLNSRSHSCRQIKRSGSTINRTGAAHHDCRHGGHCECIAVLLNKTLYLFDCFHLFPFLPME
nr:MAG TPA: hypothetical protein [Inoviridae sp.]